MTETIKLVRHVARPDAIAAADSAATELEKLGLRIVEEECQTDVDLVLAFGGDGTILSAADWARTHDAPLLGVNTGHMGFLAETNVDGIGGLVQKIANHDYRVDTRMTLDVEMRFPDGTVTRDWALNEAVVSHTDPAHPVHLVLTVDGQDVSTYGADGIILATPTGSTAYNFSAGGPVVWPDTEAIIMSPLAAHGLFTRTLVLSTSSLLEVVVLEEQWTAPEVWCDGQRRTTTPGGTSIRATKGERSLRLVRLDDTPFSSRLVHKFKLPTRGWREGEQGAPAQS